MTRNKRWRWVLSAVCAALMLSGTLAAAADEALIRPPFNDTPANRALAEKARLEMERINREYGHFIDLGDIRMHYHEWGKDGVPLIWTPGLTGTGLQLATVGPQLAKAGYHVYAISARAHGLTEAPSLEFSYNTIGDDIVHMMDKLHIPCSVIGGSSFGGFVTAAFYDNYPQRALGLIMGDGGTNPRQAQLEQYSPAYLKEHPGLSGTLAGDWSYDDPFKAFQQMLNDRMEDLGGGVRPDMLPAFWSSIKKDSKGHYVPATPADALLGSLPDFIDPVVGYRMPLLQRSFRAILPEVIFRNLNVPMIIIEPMVQTFGPPTEANKKLEAQHPNFITRIEYPGTTHPFMYVHPEWFVRDATAFLPKVREQLQARQTCRK